MAERVNTFDDALQKIKEMKKKDAALIMFVAEGCPYCAEAEEDLKDIDIPILEIEVNKETYGIAKSAGTEGTPTILIMKKGEVKRRIIGWVDTLKDYVLDVLEGEIE